MRISQPPQLRMETRGAGTQGSYQGARNFNVYAQPYRPPAGSLPKHLQRRVSNDQLASDRRHRQKQHLHDTTDRVAMPEIAWQRSEAEGDELRATRQEHHIDQMEHERQQREFDAYKAGVQHWPAQCASRERRVAERERTALPIPTAGHNECPEGKGELQSKHGVQIIY